MAKIQGCFLNSTHFDWTSKEIRFGEQISRLTGGKHRPAYALMLVRNADYRVR